MDIKTQIPSWVNSFRLRVDQNGITIFDSYSDNASFDDIKIHAPFIQSGDFITIKGKHMEVAKVWFGSFGQNINLKADWTIFEVIIEVREIPV